MAEIFNDVISGTQMPAVAGAHTVRTHAKKDLVFGPDSGPDEIYLIQTGKVRLYMMDPAGREFTINVLGPGDIFAGHTRCYGEAISEVKVAVLTRKAFLDMVHQQPEIFGRLIPVLGNSLKNAFDVIEGLVFKACSSRLAWMLLAEAEAHGEPGDAGISIEIALTTEQIASRIGATRPTTSTLINDWERSGLIARRKGEWVLKDMERLRRISAGADD